MGLVSTALSAVVSPILDIFRKKTKDVDSVLSSQSEMRKLELKDAPKSHARLWVSYLGCVLVLAVIYLLIIYPTVKFYFPEYPLPQLPADVIVRLLFGMLGIGI